MTCKMRIGIVLKTLIILNPFEVISLISVDNFAVKVTPGPVRPFKTYLNAVNKLLSKKNNMESS